MARIVGRARREELRPLARYLATGFFRSAPNADDIREADQKFDSSEDAALRFHLRAEIQQAGGSTLGNLVRGRTGVAYGELLHDVMEEVGAWNVAHWEARADRDQVQSALRADFDGVDRALLLRAERKLFLALLDRSLAKADPIERARIFASLPVPEGARERADALTRTGIDRASLAGLFGRRMSSMLVYQIALVIAGQVARNIAGQGLRLVLGGALGRYMAVWAGPVGAGLAAVMTFHDLTGPAMRKVLPCVIHLALLDMEQQITPVVGVLGSMSAGKDTMIHALFGIDTGGIDVLPGSTTVATVFDYQDEAGRVRIVNAPGEGDPRESVRGEAQAAADLLDVAVLLINAAGGVTGRSERAVYDRLVRRGVRVFPVLHKVDLCHSLSDQELLRESVADALGLAPGEVFTAAAAPDPRLRERSIGLATLHAALVEALGETKGATLPRGERVGESEG